MSNEFFCEEYRIKRLVTPKELASILSVHENFIYKNIYRIPHIEITMSTKQRTCRFDIDEVIKYFKEREIPEKEKYNYKNKKKI